jgi:tetratricopeptide (TPR) repeat protein
VARKPATPTAKRTVPGPTADRVREALARADYAPAVGIARELYAAAATPENLAVLRKTIVTAATHFADTDQYPEFARIMGHADALPTDPAWTGELAVLHARGGNAPKAKQLADALTDPAIHAQILAHTADRAVRFRTKTSLPDDLHAGFDAVLKAFDHYEKGKDDDARTALEAVGLRSPFLEWKLLLRGLIAYTAGEDARAVENFSRLAPNRFPARLAAPLRLTLDPAFRAALPPEAVAPLELRAQAFTSDAVVAGLRDVRTHLGRDKPLATAFKHAERVVPALTRTLPHLVPKLANVFYRTILHHGEPADMSKFRRLFGTPPDDPDFHRLEAQVFEDGRNFEEANRHWAAYEAWLAGSPAGWPDAVRTRARAMILLRMGQNLAELEDDREDGIDGGFGFFAAPKPKKTPPAADPTKFFDRALALAPDWTEPAVELFHRLIKTGKHERAEVVARTLLAAKPDEVKVASLLAAHLLKAGRAADALYFFKQALAANPLDKFARVRTANAVVAAARREMIARNFAAALAVLDAHRELTAENTPAGDLTLRAVIALKQKRKDEAAELAAKAVAVPNRRVVAQFLLSVNATLAKAKPAERKPYETAFAEALSGPATPLEAGTLYSGWDALVLEGIEYRGQKTQVKKIHDICLRSLDAEAPEFDFENLVMEVFRHGEWKLLAKLTAPLRKKFPRNPLVLLMAAEAEFGLARGTPRPYKVTGLLDLAKTCAEASPEPRHKALLDRIAELTKLANPPNMFDFLFNRFR